MDKNAPTEAERLKAEVDSLQTELKQKQERLRVLTPVKRSGGLIRVIYDDVEWIHPPGSDIRSEPVPRKMKGSPGNFVVGKEYIVKVEESKERWWRKAE